MLKQSATLALALLSTNVYAAAVSLMDFDLFKSNTYLMGLEYGTEQSRKANALGYGGFELAKGGNVDFSHWYRTKWKDTSITFMTQVNSNFGIIWGFSTGEKGPKYYISPGFTLGFAGVHKLSKAVTLSFKATTQFGSRLTEDTCSADYGELGGVQVVNCRLAATPMAPAETLRYLANQGPNKHKVSFNLEWKF